MSYNTAKVAAHLKVSALRVRQLRAAGLLDPDADNVGSDSKPVWVWPTLPTRKRAAKGPEPRSGG